MLCGAKKRLGVRMGALGVVEHGGAVQQLRDIGVAGGLGIGILFKKGKLYKKVAEEELLDSFLAEIDKMADQKSKQTHSE